MKNKIVYILIICLGFFWIILGQYYYQAETSSKLEKLTFNTNALKDIVGHAGLWPAGDYYKWVLDHWDDLRVDYERD